MRGLLLLGCVCDDGRLRHLQCRSMVTQWLMPKRLSMASDEIDLAEIDPRLQNGTREFPP